MLIRETGVPKKLSYLSFLQVLLSGFGVKEGREFGVAEKKRCKK